MASTEKYSNRQSELRRVVPKIFSSNMRNTNSRASEVSDASIDLAKLYWRFLTGSSQNFFKRTRYFSISSPSSLYVRR